MCAFRDLPFAADETMATYDVYLYLNQHHTLQTANFIKYEIHF